MTESRPPLVLIGAPGAGKTRTGKRVARLLNVPFIDTDKRIVEKHGPISEIFEQHGEMLFRALERAEVAQALTENAVVTLGAGAVIHPDTQLQLEDHTVAQLTVSAEAVEERIAGGKRPLLAGGISSWQRLVETRQPIYDRLAPRRFDTSGRPLDQIANEIVAWLQEEKK